MSDIWFRLRRGIFLSLTISDTPHYGNVPFEIPDNWVWCRLEDIANIGTGATPNRLNKEYYNNGIIPWINSSSTNCTYITEASEYITEKAINETNCKIYPIGTLIVAMYGEGKTRGQVSELLIESATNQACAAISLIDTNIKAYIKIYFEGNYFHLRKLAEGGNQPNLSIGKISNYTIPLPPLSEQHRITTEIEKCFSIIDIIECGKADLQTAIKQAKSKILDLAIHGKLVPQDPNDEPAIELLQRINPDFTPCDNGHSGKLPQGWCYCNYKDVFSDVPSKAYQILQSDIQNDGKYPVISQSVNYIEGYTNTNNVFQHKIPCIIFGDHTRNVKYVDFDFVVGADGVKILCPKVNVKWSFYMIMYASSHIENKGYSRHFGQIVKFSYKLPPIAEQQRIVQKIGELFSVLDNIQKALEV